VCSLGPRPEACQLRRNPRKHGPYWLTRDSREHRRPSRLSQTVSPVCEMTDVQSQIRKSQALPGRLCDPWKVGVSPSLECTWIGLLPCCSSRVNGLAIKSGSRPRGRLDKRSVATTLELPSENPDGSEATKVGSEMFVLTTMRCACNVAQPSVIKLACCFWC